VSLSDVRDFVIVIWGIVSILLVLIRLAMAAGTLYFGMKGMRIAHRFTNTQVRQYLDKGLEIAMKVEGRTARLPGAPGAGRSATDLVATVQEIREMNPPFRSRKKSWRPI